MSAPRPSGKLSISFGIVNVPVSVYNAIDEEAVKIKRSMRSPDGNPIKFPTADAETGEIISRSDTHMVYTTKDGTEIELTDDEIAEALGKENGACELLGFYEVAEIGQYVATGLMQVRPQTVKVGKNTTHPNDKAFALLMSALEETKTFALLSYVLRGKPHLGALRSDGTMLVLAWEQEIKDQLPWPDVELNAKEKAMAHKLIDTLLGSFEPAGALANEGIESVRTYAEVKAKGSLPEKKKDVEKIESVDLMADLEKSLELALANK